MPIPNTTFLLYIPSRAWRSLARWPLGPSCTGATGKSGAHMTSMRNVTTRPDSSVATCPLLCAGPRPWTSVCRDPVTRALRYLAVWLRIVVCLHHSQNEHYTYSHTHLHLSAHNYTHTHTPPCTHTSTHIHTHIHSHTNTYTNLPTQAAYLYKRAAILVSLTTQQHTLESDPLYAALPKFSKAFTGREMRNYLP